MKIFLDSSVLLSACGSSRSLCRLVVEIAPERGWSLVSAVYCRAETSRNIQKVGAQAASVWPELQQKIDWVANALVSNRPLLLAASKDKPVLVSALAASRDVLLTLDRGDFGIVLGTTVYGMMVSTPREFLVAEGLG
ncbi:MAG: hypothetical protein ACKO2G_09360 [Verrucomicrobiales bacterium]